MSPAWHFVIGFILIAAAAIAGTIGTILVKKNWGYWETSHITNGQRLNELKNKIEHLPQRNPEAVKASEALIKGNYNLAETLTEVSDNLDIIERNAKSFYEGHYPDYKVVAGQLQKLLCNESAEGNNSLILKVFPYLKLHPMRIKINEEIIRKQAEELRKLGAPVGDYPLVWEPYSFRFGPSHQSNFFNIFDETSMPISLNEWLNQIAVILDSRPFSLKNIIMSVAKESGSADDYLLASKKTHHRAEGQRATHHHEPMIIGIGEYIVEELRRQIGDLHSIQR